jgi:hypothetical protein
MRRLRRLSVAIQFALAVSSVSAFAAGGVVAYLILDGNQTKTLAEVSCYLTRNSMAGFNTITGDPIVDCAAMWPSATGGRAAAPPLAAWELDSGTETAVVQPASWGRPAPIRGVGWQRLPSGWTVNLGVVELTDQLNDISISPYGGPPCSYVNRDEQTIRSLFRVDGLQGWRIVVTAFQRGATVSAGCRFTIPNVDGSARTVQLIQNGAPGHVRLTPQDKKLINAGNTANHKLYVLDKSINRTLSKRCEAVNAAAALWTRRARADGFNPTSPAYYRTLNATPNPVPARLSDYYYTLVKQPASQNTGSCAHILVMRAGGGDLTVYAARITP